MELYLLCRRQSCRARPQKVLRRALTFLDGISFGLALKSRRGIVEPLFSAGLRLVLAGYSKRHGQLVLPEGHHASSQT